MEKVQIDNKQFFSITVIYILANDLLRGIFFNIYSNNIWILELIGITLSIIIFLLYTRLYKFTKYKMNLIEIIEKLIGKHLSKLLFILYPMYFIFLSSVILRMMTENIIIFLINNASIFIIVLLMIFVVYYVLICGIEVFARLSELYFGIMFFIFIFFAIAILLVNEVDFKNFLPILEHGFKPIALDSIKMGYGAPYGQLFVLLFIYDHVNDKQKAVKTGVYSILMAAIVLLKITFEIITIMGYGGMDFVLIPSARVSTKIDIEMIVQRFDIFTLNLLILLSIIRVGVLVYGSKQMMSNLIKIKPKIILLLLCVLLLINVLSLNMLEIEINILMYRFINPYISLFFEIIIPFLLILIAFLKKSKFSKLN